jgi:hypothetical protein
LEKSEKSFGETADCADFTDRKAEGFEDTDPERATGAWLQENAAAYRVVLTNTKVRDREDAIANTRDACALQNSSVTSA